MPGGGAPQEHSFNDPPRRARARCTLDAAASCTFKIEASGEGGKHPQEFRLMISHHQIPHRSQVTEDGAKHRAGTNPVQPVQATPCEGIRRIGPSSAGQDLLPSTRGMQISTHVFQSLQCLSVGRTGLLHLPPVPSLQTVPACKQGAAASCCLLEKLPHWFAWTCRPRRPPSIAFAIQLPGSIYHGWFCKRSGPNPQHP